MGKEVFKTDRAPAPIGPYSQAVRAGNLLFVSGQGPVDPKTRQVFKGDIKEQARVTLENVKAILEDAGTSLDNVVKATVFLANIEDYASVNEVYSQYFGENPPARTCIQAARLPGDISIEIEVVALIPC